MNDILSNLSNSQAGIADVVQIEYNKHWTRGLRQSELTIIEKKKSLLTNAYSSRKAKRSADFLSEILPIMASCSRLLSFLPIIGTWVTNKYLNLKEHVELSRQLLESNASLFRDCEMELEAAVNQKNEILKNHPEAKEIGYMGLQEKYSKLALTQQKIHYLRPKYLSSQTGVPEAIWQALYECNDETERGVLWSAIVEDNEEILEWLQIANQIKNLPNERRELFVNLLIGECNENG